MFNNAIAKLVHDVSKTHFKERSGMSVCELGNQTYKGTEFQANLLGGKSVNSTDQFYAEFGFDSYIAIDVNSKLNAIPMDLNYILKDRNDYHEQFDMVTNNGTGEHIFNQASVFENIHNLTKVGGWMLHVLPFQRQCDHGFFNFQPNLFAAIADQNDYDIGISCITTSMATPHVDISLTVERQTRLCDDIGMWQWDPKWGPEIVCALQKTRNADFMMPFQGLYKKDIESDLIRKSYKVIPN